MSRKRVALNDSQSADLCDAVYGDALLSLPRAIRFLQCSCEHTHNDGQSLHIHRCRNLIFLQDHEIGHTLCRLCRPLEDEVEDRGTQIMVLAQNRVQERGIILTPPIHFGAYYMSITNRLRTTIHCRCHCNFCNHPDNANRYPVTDEDSDLLANTIAEQDIADFVSGELPIPQRPRPTSRRRTS